MQITKSRSSDSEFRNCHNRSISFSHSRYYMHVRAIIFSETPLIYHNHKGPILDFFFYVKTIHLEHKPRTTVDMC